MSESAPENLKVPEQENKGLFQLRECGIDHQQPSFLFILIFEQYVPPAPIKCAMYQGCASGSLLHDKKGLVRIYIQDISMYRAERNSAEGRNELETAEENYF